MIRDDWGLLDKLDDIAIILNEATNIYNLNAKLRSIKKDLGSMQLKIKKHDLTGKKEHTHLLEGPSIEENQVFLDEHITSVQMMQASSYCKHEIKRKTKQLERRL